MPRKTKVDRIDSTTEMQVRKLRSAMCNPYYYKGCPVRVTGWGDGTFYGKTMIDIGRRLVDRILVVIEYMGPEPLPFLPGKCRLILRRMTTMSLQEFRRCFLYCGCISDQTCQDMISSFTTSEALKEALPSSEARRVALFKAMALGFDVFFILDRSDALDAAKIRTPKIQRAK